MQQRRISNGPTTVQFSLREFAIVQIGATLSFAAGLEYSRIDPYVGFYFRLLAVAAVWTSWFITAIFLQRYLVTLSILFTLAAMFGYMACPQAHLNLVNLSISTGIFGFATMLTAVPLTIHRMTNRND